MAIYKWRLWRLQSMPMHGPLSSCRYFSLGDRQPYIGPLSSIQYHTRTFQCKSLPVFQWNSNRSVSSAAIANKVEANSAAAPEATQNSIHFQIETTQSTNQSQIEATQSTNQSQLEATQSTNDSQIEATQSTNQSQNEALQCPSLPIPQVASTQSQPATYFVVQGDEEIKIYDSESKVGQVLMWMQETLAAGSNFSVSSYSSPAAAVKSCSRKKKPITITYDESAVSKLSGLKVPKVKASADESKSESKKVSLDSTEHHQTAGASLKVEKASSITEKCQTGSEKTSNLVASGTETPVLATELWDHFASESVICKASPETRTIKSNEAKLTDQVIAVKEAKFSIDSYCNYFSDMARYSHLLSKEFHRDNTAIDTDGELEKQLFRTEDETSLFCPNESVQRYRYIPQELMDKFFVFTDGGCSDNGFENSEATSAVILPRINPRYWIGTPVPDRAIPGSPHGKHGEQISPSNNRGEAYAILLALKSLLKMKQNGLLEKLYSHPEVHSKQPQVVTIPILICSDSSLCIKTIEDYYKKWKKNNWRKQCNSIPKNLDIFGAIEKFRNLLEHGHHSSEEEFVVGRCGKRSKNVVKKAKEVKEGTDVNVETESNNITTFKYKVSFRHVAAHGKEKNEFFKFWNNVADRLAASHVCKLPYKSLSSSALITN